MTAEGASVACPACLSSPGRPCLNAAAYPVGDHPGRVAEARSLCERPTVPSTEGASVAGDCCYRCAEGGDPIAGHCVDIDGFFWHHCARTEQSARAERA